MAWGRKKKHTNNDVADAKQLQALSNVKEVPAFSFEGSVRTARIASIIDGDTVWLAMVHEGAPTRFKVRLAGIDTPEMRPSLKDPNRDAIKREAVIAKDALAELLPEGSLCRVECGKFGKFGRILATLYTIDGVNVNEYLVERGYAVRNTGRTEWETLWPALQKQRFVFAAEQQQRQGEQQQRAFTALSRRRRWYCCWCC